MVRPRERIRRCCHRRLSSRQARRRSRVRDEGSTWQPVRAAHPRLEHVHRQGSHGDAAPSDGRSGLRRARRAGREILARVCEKRKRKHHHSASCVSSGGPLLDCACHRLGRGDVRLGSHDPCGRGHVARAQAGHGFWLSRMDWRLDHRRGAPEGDVRELPKAHQEISSRPARARWALHGPARKRASPRRGVSDSEDSS